MSSLLKDGSMDYHGDYATRSNHKAKSLSPEGLQATGRFTANAN